MTVPIQSGALISETSRHTLSSSRVRAPRGWMITTLAVAFIVCLPILSVLYVALFPEENIWPHLIDTVLPRYIRTTLQLLIGVGILTFVFGVTSAWLISMCRFPGRKLFEWALLLPFAVPAYVIAYVYTDMLEYSGWVQTGLRDWFGWQSARDYWFPEIRSLGGAILMLSLVLYPYVYMLSRAAFMEQSQSLLMASRSLGCSPWKSFWRVSLPVTRPAIAIGLTLVLLETLNDFGTVDYFAVQTLTQGLFDTWLNMGNIGGAAQIACCMLLFVCFFIWLERRSRARQKHYQSADRYKNLPRYHLKGLKAALATLFCLALITLGFLIPFYILANYAYQYFEQSFTSDFISHARNSFLLSGLAALATIAIGLILTYARRLNRHRAVRAVVAVSSLGYAMPGAVLAIGVLVPFAAFDNTLDGFLRQHFGVSSGLLLSGTLFAVLFAYVVRFLAVSAGALQAGLDQITPSMDMAAQSLGSRPTGVLFRIHIPLLRRSMVTAAIIVFVDCMKELPATLILRPFNFETLATHVHQYATHELIKESALGALVIVGLGLIPVILLNRSMSSAKKGEQIQRL